MASLRLYTMQIVTLLLAAGRSSRLGQPKQLLLHDGQPLVRRMAEVALTLGPVVVVTGSNADAVANALTSLPTHLVFNADYETGMASSLRAGLTYLTDRVIPLDAVLILLTDQPHVDSSLLQTIVETAERTQKGIVASRYGDTLGVPVLFRADYVPSLLTLTGDSGARKLIRQHVDDCAEVPFPNGAVDLDTPEDVANWEKGDM